MFRYNPSLELYLGLRKVSERMTAKEIGGLVEETSLSGATSSGIPKIFSIEGELRRRTETKTDGVSSANVRDHAPRVIEALEREAVDLRDMCDPIVGRVASYSGFGMMGRRYREGDQYRRDAQDIQLWYSCYPDSENEGCFKLLFLHGSRKGNYVHDKSDSLPVVRSGSDTHEVFDYIRECSDSPKEITLDPPSGPLTVDRFLWMLAPKGRRGGEVASETDQSLNFEALFYIESIISDNRGRYFFIPHPLLQSCDGELPRLSEIVVATPYVVQSARRSWKIAWRESLNMMARIIGLR